jgi:hypothetical protein
MTPPTLPTPPNDEHLRLAYEQQVENVREAKRLQWNLTYLTMVALAALVGAEQQLRERRPWDACVARIVFTVLGGLTAAFAVVLIGNASRRTRESSLALGTIADRWEVYLKPLLGVPSTHTSTRGRRRRLVHRRVIDPRLRAARIVLES